MRPKVVQPNHPREAFALGIRKYLVTLRYARETLRFAILSDEATSADEAAAIAVKRVGDGRFGKTRLGDLMGDPIVCTDTEEARKKAGISDEGYPPTYGSFSLKWYDSPAQLLNRCRVCGVPPRPQDRSAGQQYAYCAEHQPKAKRAAA